MSKMRWVNTDFWSDTWIVDNLNPLDRYLFIYLFTNPHTNVAGVYELSLRIMSFETGIEREELLRMIKRLEPKINYIDGWVVLRNGIKNQNYTNPKIKTGISAVLENVPSELLQHIKWPKDFGNPKPEGSKQTSLMDESYIDHGGSSHSDSDSNSDSNSDIDTDIDIDNTMALKSAEPPKSIQAVQKIDTVAKLYYEAIKSLGLPIFNHDNVRKKITAMKGEATEHELVAYLEFMRDKFAGLRIDFKPDINEALDIYGKRLAVGHAFKRAVEDQQPYAWKPRFA